MIAAAYLAAGGVGTLIVPNATEAQIATLEAHGPDTAVATDGSRARGPARSDARVVARRRAATRSRSPTGAAGSRRPYGWRTRASR